MYAIVEVLRKPMYAIVEVLRKAEAARRHHHPHQLPGPSISAF
jgi:hypothetical protein